VPIGNPSLRLGSRCYDLTRRCLVMGLLDGTSDSVSNQGATPAVDRMLQRAEGLVNDGADVLEFGCVQAGPGQALSEAEELERIVRAVEALVGRFDVPVAANTGSAPVLAAACAAGAVVGNDSRGFADPEYLPTAARAGASVVARPPQSTGLVSDVAAFLADRAERARAAGLAPDQIMVDAGLDLAKTAAERAALLRASERLAALGYPLVLSASGATFPGLLPDRAGGGRRAASLTAVAYGVSRGCRIVRVHDVAGTVRVVRVIERILEAGAGAEREHDA
jgi:dihydropteroate synthase